MTEEWDAGEILPKAARKRVAMAEQSIRTSDGGQLHLFSFGKGPGVVMVCGTNTAAATYFRAARKLSLSLPVHVYDRRGRPGSSPQPENYSMATEISDLRSVMDATGSTAVFGHSYGGAVVLEAALQLPASRIAVYDPVPNIGGLVPTGFLPALEDAVQRGDVARAVAVIGKGISTNLRETPLPDPAFRLLLWCISRATRKGRSWRGTVGSSVKEIAWLHANQPSAERYADITIPVLVLYGARSDTFFRLVAESLAGSLPLGRCSAVPGSDHGALDYAPAALLTQVAEFFTGQR
ncbi:alpha/beta hydrolase [Arthrobacter sp. CDRTa11]|nr:alpha/beta hydrolase [Arthrobacter sp. CDRTa11]